MSDAKLALRKGAIKMEINYKVNKTVTIDDLVNKFLAWPVPESIAPDNLKGIGCSKGMNPGSTGTNLMSADQAKEMFEYLFS